MVLSGGFFYGPAEQDDVKVAETGVRFTAKYLRPPGETSLVPEKA